MQHNLVLTQNSLNYLIIHHKSHPENHHLDITAKISLENRMIIKQTKIATFLNLKRFYKLNPKNPNHLNYIEQLKST